MSVQDGLEEAGYAVLHAPTGAAALVVLDAAEPKIAGLITDIRLGSGPTGWEIARRARELLPHLPIIYTSGDSAHQHSALGVPDSIMVQKPFAVGQIATAIANLLNASLHPGS